MAICAIPVFNTAENKREPMVRACLQSFAKTINWHKSHHRLFVIDDASTCEKTQDLYREASNWLPFTLIQNSSNRGTALSVNRAWVKRKPGEAALKADSDIVIHDVNWLDKLEECFELDEKLGIVGLRRRDLLETPDAPVGDWRRSELIRLPHVAGRRVHTIEKVGHVIGSCQLYSSRLLEKIGYLVQFGRYGLDDCLAAIRCAVAGFYSAFYCGVDIEHVDPGDTPYQTWKEKYSGERMEKFNRLKMKYLDGSVNIYHGPEQDLDLESI